MMFNSRLCDLCKNTLNSAFGTLKERESDTVPHHPTKESLIDSVLPRSCHLCRFILYHFKLRWALGHRKGLKDLREEPTTLTENDFKDSDFHFAAFPRERVIAHEYMLELPEDIKLHAQVTRYRDGSDGVFGLVTFDCDAPNHDIKAAVQRFWIFDERGTLSQTG
jgi:hypothetical protein